MSNATPSNLVAARLLQLSTEARASGNLDLSGRLSLAATISDLTSAAYASDHDRDHDRAVEAIAGALERFAAGVRAQALRDATNALHRLA